MLLQWKKHFLTLYLEINILNYFFITKKMSLKDRCTYSQNCFINFYFISKNLTFNFLNSLLFFILLHSLFSIIKKMLLLLFIGFVYFTIFHILQKLHCGQNVVLKS